MGIIWGIGKREELGDVRAAGNVKGNEVWGGGGGGGGVCEVCWGGGGLGCVGGGGGGGGGLEI